MQNRKRYIQAIIEVMSEEDAANGIHIDTIAQRLIVRGFEVTAGQGFGELRDLANRLILSDCRRGGKHFAKVMNERTGSSRRGMYILKTKY